MKNRIPHEPKNVRNSRAVSVWCQISMSTVIGPYKIDDWIVNMERSINLLKNVSCSQCYNMYYNTISWQDCAPSKCFFSSVIVMRWNITRFVGSKRGSYRLATLLPRFAFSWLFLMEKFETQSIEDPLPCSNIIAELNHFGIKTIQRKMLKSWK